MNLRHCTLTAAVTLTVIGLTACQSDQPAAKYVIPHTTHNTETPNVPAYHRSEFGPGWALVHGHCDTREVVLERDEGPAAIDTDSDGCRDDGPVPDPYTGTTIPATQAQIDHVFPLKRAWNMGAWKWTPVQRRIYANDQSNLRAVTGTVNEAKGDLGPGQWRPPARSGWCVYATIYRATADRWNLTVTPEDDTALRDMTSSCRTR